jgi:hypothetical protein
MRAGGSVREAGKPDGFAIQIECADEARALQLRDVLAEIIEWLGRKQNPGIRDVAMKSARVIKESKIVPVWRRRQ